MIVSSAVTAALITGAITGGTTVAATAMNNRSNSKAAKEAEKSFDKQINMEEARERRRREEWEREQEELKRQWDAEQAWAQDVENWNRERVNRSWEAKAPYRQAGGASLAKLQELAAGAGVQLRPLAAAEGDYAQMVQQERSLGALGRRTA